MAKQTINIGAVANDGTGSNLRAGGTIINDNFNEIYTAIGNGSTITLTPSSSIALISPRNQFDNTITTFDQILDNDGNPITFDDTTP